MTEDNNGTLKGTVEKIVYKNETNGYTVAIIRTLSGKETATGSFSFINVGENVELTGKFTEHPAYGRQFNVSAVKSVEMVSKAAMLRYLSSGVIRGVGPATAARIVERFGEKSIDIIENHPEELSVINGISMQKAINIGIEYKKKYGIKDLMMLLSPYSFSLERCVKIYKAFGEQSASVIKENPYSLCGGDIGVSFETAERMAYDFGIDKESDLRLCAGVEYIITQNLSNGHTCVPREKLVAIAVKLLESDYYHVEDICDKLVLGMRLFTFSKEGRDFLALPQYYNGERYIAAKLSSMRINGLKSAAVEELEIDYVENKLGIRFETAQREAVKKAVTNGVFILTGGPGTGKTTALNGIIEIFEKRGCDIALTAPTGRAAKRMTELTGRQAKTIHRLLEAEAVEGDKHKFSRNEQNPVAADVVIVDETSMLDTMLFESLLRAVKNDSRLILVGDTNQLPSIGAGNILGDLISSERFVTVELKTVFRQAKESAIITNAHAIINGENCDISNKQNDFFFIQKSTKNEVINAVLELCAERIPKTYGFDPVENIQVICPSKKFDTGTVNLNNLLQTCLNPDTRKPQIAYKGIFYRKGDKVMQTKNNYDIEWEREDGERGFGVYNGDVGIITSVEKNLGQVTVKIDDKKVVYTGEMLDELELAYAVTVHKSQGSEFDCVLIPLFGIPDKLCYRNLIYTAITRAKKLLILAGDKRVFSNMVENDKKTLRYTLLCDLLAQYED